MANQGPRKIHFKTLKKPQGVSLTRPAISTKTKNDYVHTKEEKLFRKQTILYFVKC